MDGETRDTLPPAPESDGDPTVDERSSTKKAWTKPVVRPLYSIHTVRSGPLFRPSVPEFGQYTPNS